MLDLKDMTDFIEKEWMWTFSGRSDLLQLIQGVLGCRCPEEVFDHYLVTMGTSGICPKVQIILGDRLLVWLLDGEKLDAPDHSIDVLLEEGRKERDHRGLNRFRLVVFGGEQALPPPLQIDDPKVHLHLLGSWVPGSGIGVF